MTCRERRIASSQERERRTEEDSGSEFATLAYFSGELAR
jgi:hypothetical protein